MRKFTSLLMQPAFIFVPFVLTGLAVWFFLPADYLRLRAKEDFSFSGLLYFLLWYAVIILAAFLGKAVPLRFMSKSRKLNKSFNLPFYFIVSFLGFLGCASLLMSLGGFSGIAAAIAEQQVNQLKNALYENYNSGFLTFRYLTSVSATIAFYNLLSRRKMTLPLDILNISMLLIVALVSARILIFQAVIFSLFLRYSAEGQTGSFKPVRSLVIFAAVFATLVGFTYSRSAGTYKNQLNIENPILVTAVEFSRYIAMPVQVTVGVANIATTDRMEKLMNFQPMYLAPSFLHPRALKMDNSGGVGAQWYYSHIDVPGTLTTNSAFAAAVGYLGHFVFIGLPPIIFLFSAIFYLVARSGDLVLTLYAGVVLYAFFELWRTYYFSAGSFIFFNIIFAGYIAVQFLRGELVLVRKTASG